jgi:hypothetical protein
MATQQKPAQTPAQSQPNDIVGFIKSNAVPFGVRSVAILSSLIVFACISDKAQFSGACFYGIDGSNLTGKSSICGFGIFVGVVSWLMEIALLLLLLKPVLPFLAVIVLPAQWPMIQLGIAAVWDVFWFANAINLSAGYSTTCGPCVASKYQSGALGAVFFSYVSLGLWSFLTFEFYKGWREGSPKTNAPTQARANQGKPNSAAQPPLTSVPVNDPALEGNAV